MNAIAAQTLQACHQGSYRAPTGSIVDISGPVAKARAGTVLYRPQDVAALPVPRASGPLPSIEVTGETTSAAARRLVEEAHWVDPLVLNFASARSVGGGFLSGAKAQEEDLCRASALYVCLETQPAYYEANREHRSCLYTDHAIYSPAVPFFRGEHLEWLETPFEVSVLTMPAPNAAELRVRPDAKKELNETLQARCLKVLQMAALHGHRALVLGAWGCGAFRNDPAVVAEGFARALEQTRGSFETVVFAVYERQADGPNRAAFMRRFS